MAFLDRLFKKSEPDSGPSDIRFGRYSDAYKESLQYDLWDQSLELFDKQQYLDAYECFLEYLNDPSEENISYSRKGEKLDFEIIQGSKKLKGQVTRQKVRVEVQVAKAKSLNEKLFLQLLEYNFDLKYCRFGLTQDNHISIVFDTSTIDGSPYKLYYALKEVANYADKNDDLLIHDYSDIEHTDHDLFHHFSEDRKEIQYRYLIDQIQNTLTFIKSEAAVIDGFAGGVAYALLSLGYKLDYLIKPEGYLMDRLEEINTIYFNNDIPDIGEKTTKIVAEYEQILQHDSTILKSEMYWVKSTFGITAPVSHDRVVNFIEGELANMDWYIEHGSDELAKSIPEYIIGYVLFHFAPPKPDLELLKLYIRIKESAYFQQLGFSAEYLTGPGSFDRKAIKDAIADIVEEQRKHYPNLDPNYAVLRYSSEAIFAKSFLQMIQQLDMTRIG